MSIPSGAAISCATAAPTSRSPTRTVPNLISIILQASVRAVKMHDGFSGDLTGSRVVAEYKAAYVTCMWQGSFDESRRLGVFAFVVRQQIL